jgi:hypothetical protein
MVVAPGRAGRPVLRRGERHHGARPEAHPAEKARGGDRDLQGGGQGGALSDEVLCVLSAVHDACWGIDKISASSPT